MSIPPMTASCRAPRSRVSCSPCRSARCWRSSRRPRPVSAAPGRGSRAGFPPPTSANTSRAPRSSSRQHPVPKAKFPVDRRSRPPAGLTNGPYAQVVTRDGRPQPAVMMYASGGSGEELKAMLAMIKSSPYPDRMVVFTNPYFSRSSAPGYGQRRGAARGRRQGRRAGARRDHEELRV